MLQVGAGGVTDAVLAAVAEALDARELMKVRVLDSAPVDAREAAASLADRLEDVHVPQVIGRTLVLYRPFPDGPEIRLPD